MVRMPSYGLISGHFGSRRSQRPRRVSSTLDIPAPNEIALHGSQVDILVPNQPESGLVDNSLDHSTGHQSEDHEDDIVEHLEAIDPYVATVSHLSNAANSILIPPMSLYSRRPIIHLPRSEYSVLPDSEKGRTEHVDDLDRHVENALRKRDKLRQTAAGVWSFIKTPMGIITAIYGFLVVFWGAAIVLFLLNWIPTGSKDRQGFWVEISSQVENALFTITGIGLLPWRIVDTYRITKIWKLKRISTRLRKSAGLPELYDEDDLPDPQYDPDYVHVLTDEQQKELHHQQKEFAKSQTWYRPHGTESHRAFPIATALLICLFVDGNSFFQAILCACMWSMNRFQRPAWTTGTLIPASFLCGIIAAILIWRGGQKTKRTKAVEETLRTALEAEQQTGVPAAVVAVNQYRAQSMADFDDVASTSLLDNHASPRGHFVKT
ncbi:hypothetical protein JB92DRAFT_1319962 [Gautieria morchelliformis]|nr:hypothetical protein JB92DRAFT_1319962 [Gautieria morchelliformis]